MQEFPQKWKMNPLYYLMLMYHMQWQLRDEDDEEYEPRVEIRRLVSNIPMLPDIAAFGPKAVGALKLLQDWIKDDVGAFLEAHEKEDFLDAGLEYGRPLEVVTPLKDVKEEGADGAASSPLKSKTRCRSLSSRV